MTMFAPDAGVDLFSPSGATFKAGDYSVFGDEPKQAAIDSDHAHVGANHGTGVVMFIGRRGHGKTALLTAIAGHMQRQFRRRKFAGRIFSNYAINFLDPIRDYYHPYLIEDVQEFPLWFRDGYLVMDEIQSFATSRRSMSKSNVNISAFLTQIRHRNIQAAFTTQFSQTIDYQVLLQVDLFIRVKTLDRWPGGFPRIVELEKHDYWGQFTGKDYRKAWPPQPQDADGWQQMFIPESLRGTYNTDQIIASNYWDADVRDRVNIEEEENLGGENAWFKAARAPMEQAQDYTNQLPDPVQLELALLELLPASGAFNIRPFIGKARDATGGDVTDAESLAEYLREKGYKIHKKAQGTGHSYQAERITA